MKEILRKYKNITLLTLFFIIYLVIITRFGKYIYGSTLDWNCQHYYIPDYFRKLFYETGNLFPNFAFNIGAGQNIYNLSYYGLLSPIILISYLLPFISMKTYIQISSILLIYISIILFYKWINTKFDKKISFISTVIFLLSAPLLFQSHRHIMFVNYMPFLMMGLIGVDKYFCERRKTLLIISVFLITTTSYFFSVGALVCICIYWLYMYVKLNKKIEIKKFIKDGVKFLYPIIVGVMMAMVVLLPTFMSILNGRGESSVDINYLSLIIPNIKMSNLFYGTYSLGLTSIALFSLIYLIVKTKKEKRLLGIVLSILILFPIFIFILNAGMYVNGKVLIPFIPLFILVISITLDKLLNLNDISWVSLLIYVFVCILIILTQNTKMLILDFMLISISVLLLYLKKKQNLLFFSIMLVSFISFIGVNLDDTLVIKGSNYSNGSTKELVEYVQEKDNSFYRISNRNGGLGTANDIVNSKYYTTSIYSSVSNEDYKNFYYNLIGNDILNRSRGQLSAPQNLLFNVYMGNKYVIGSHINELGYTKLKEVNGNYLYKNDQVLPIGYSTSKLMSKSYYEKLQYPYNVEAMLNYVIVDKEVQNSYSTNIEKIDLYYNITDKSEVDIINKQNYLEINALQDSAITLDINNDLDNKILFIKFELIDQNSCSVGDSLISINNVVNKLTCKGWKYNNKNYVFEYTISNKDLDKLNIKFDKGVYKIKNIETYTLDYDLFVKGYNNVDKFNIDTSKTRSDVIEGTINVLEDGYFNLSIPYDKAFSIYVDEEKIDYEKTDLSFIGFKISKGNHNIKIVYTAPTLNISKIISIFGIMLFISAIYIESIPKKK